MDDVSVTGIIDFVIEEKFDSSHTPGVHSSEDRKVVLEKDEAVY